MYKFRNVINFNIYKSNSNNNNFDNFRYYIFKAKIKPDSALTLMFHVLYLCPRLLKKHLSN